MSLSVDMEQAEIQKEEEPYGLGCALESFAEIEEVNKLVDNLKLLLNSEVSVVERAYERFNFILGQYTEQPHLLDAHIDNILEKCIAIIRDPESILELKHMTFRYMFIVVNVRGYKVIVRHLPHEVSDFEPVLQLLEGQDPNDSKTWTTRYILLLWLSIIVMIPFHMSRLDGLIENNTQDTVMKRVLNIIKIYTIVSDKCRDAAAYLSSRFITRYDVKEVYLVSYFEWAMTSSLEDSDNIFIKHGTLASIGMILKHGKREDLLPHARTLLQWIINPAFKRNTGSNVQKLVYKIIQRIGLSFLPPRLASWRYTRGNRSLSANLSAGDGRVPTGKASKEAVEECADDFEVPEEVEEIIDQLIQGLANADGIVRWSAAKGMGRVTGRLPKELADEVVGSVLQLFNPREGDGSWHGGCLALAELGRRGLLLPQRLPEVVPVVLKALVYDEPRGYSSVGSHIRDAACYVCWSFARAYETDVLKPFVNQIASNLLVVTCFDREINCRRAASAAFQENVGRQGTFPHGISILTTADFFAVSVRNNSYLNISVYIAQFPEYTTNLIDHLVDRKVDHWDIMIRELTAKALHKLTPLKPDYMVNKVLPELFAKAHSIDLNKRHGAVLAIGDIIHGLSLLANFSKIGLILNIDLIEKSRNLIGLYKERLYFRGLGGELMRQACCDFIEKCSLSSMPFHGDDVVEQWLSLINECIPYDVINIRSAAMKALPVLLTKYFSEESKKSERDEIISAYLKELLSTNTQVNRMGHALAIGSLPGFMLLQNINTILEALIEATIITPSTLKWAESRRDSVKALTSVMNTLQDSIGNDLSEKHLDNVLNAFLQGLQDYTQDKRGDIGAWMREASMSGLQSIALLLTDKKPTFLKPDTVIKILSKIAQQAVEKIDRTRALGGRSFYSFIYHNNRVPYIPHYEDLLKIFPEEECSQLNWNSASATFPKFVQLIKYPEFTYDVMLGMVCSVGGLTETLVKYSCSSLFAFMTAEEKIRGVAEIKRICDVIHQIFVNLLKQDRITVPMFRFIDKLFESGCIDLIIHDQNSDFAPKMLKLIQMEITGCRDVYKLIDAISALCQFIQVKREVCDIALIQLSILLCHRQSYIRRSTSTKLYESLLVNGDSSNIKEENLDDVLLLLSETNWEEPVDVIKPIRNELCRLMGVRVPVPKIKK